MIGLELKCDLETKFLTFKVRFGLMEVVYLDKEKREDEETTIDQDGVRIGGGRHLPDRAILR